MFRYFRFFVFLLAASAFGQSAPQASRSDAAHFPQLIQAELPLCPEGAVHMSGSVDIQVTVDSGTVVDAQVKSVDVEVRDPLNTAVYDANYRSALAPILANPSLANVKTWRFRAVGRTTFLVKYIYKIEGDETPLPENPRVEFELPFVTVISRPVKPGCNDCNGGYREEPVR